MKIVSVINYKGGVGKTTLTANLGAELAFRRKRVLLLDLDAQASLTFSFMSPDAWVSQIADTKTIKSWFDSFETGKPIPLSSLIFTPARTAPYVRAPGQLDMIFSHLGLINVDLELATKLGGASLVQSKRNFINVHRILSDGIKSIDPDRYDLVLIDCPLILI
jgi:chromosome partitioning protein